MAKGIGPILLLGGAAALAALTMRKKAGGTVGGMKMIGDCEGIEMVDAGDAFEFMTQVMNDQMIRDGVDPNTLSGVSRDKYEEYINLVFFHAFPECPFPPNNPGEFKIIGIDGKERSWDMMMSLMLEQYDKLVGGEEVLLTSNRIPQRMKKTYNIAKVIIGD